MSDIRNAAARISGLNLGSSRQPDQVHNGQQEERYPIPTLTSEWIDKLIFLGTGTSGQVPAIHCITPDADDLLDGNNANANEMHEIHCSACADCVKLGDESRNRRMCTAALVVGSDKSKTDPRERLDSQLTIMIDCGPTFYSSAIRVFPDHKLRRIDAVLLTHAHADAILGLDHLRAWTLGGVVQPHVDVYLTQETMDVAANMFPYLVDRRKATGGGGVGALRWHIIDPSKPFNISRGKGSVQVTPLPVLHGFVNRSEPFQFVGYRIAELSYISDCHEIPESTSKLVEGSSVLVIDALKWERHASHFSIAQALQYTLSIQSLKLSLLTDLTHMVEHWELSDQLEKWQVGMRKVASAIAAKPSQNGAPWWKGYWDEGESEDTRHVELLQAPPENSQTTSSDGPNVPVIRVAYDRQSIEFN